MIRQTAAAFLLGVLLWLSGCTMTMRVEKVDDTFGVDADGNIIDVQTWRYADGEMVRTKRVISKTGNVLRSGTPGERSVFVDL